ncbi:hypothetical protein DMH27_13225 [Raoultella planticola]|nr:hypothetical protein [Raoultella planticola]
MNLSRQKIPMKLCRYRLYFPAVKRKDAHIDFLMKMIGLFRQTDKMDAILKASSPSVVKTLLEEVIN